MSRTPSHAHPAGGPAATPAPAAKTAAPTRPGAPAAPRPGGGDLLTKRNLIIGGSAAAVLAVVVVLFTWKPWQPEPPRLNAQPVEIARFGATGAFDSLPFAQQREYMDILDETEKDLLEEYKAGNLTDHQYRRALQLGWYDKHLDRAENYAALPPAKRPGYLDKWARPKDSGKSEEQEEEEKEKKDAGRVGARKAEDIKRDKSNEEADVRRWPADVRQKWTDYRAALAARKQYWEDLQAKQSEASAGGDNKPTGG